MLPNISSSTHRGDGLPGELVFHQGFQGRDRPPQALPVGLGAAGLREMKVRPVEMNANGQNINDEDEQVPCWQVHRWQRSSQLKLLVFVVALVGIITVFAVLPTNEYLEAYAKWSEDKIVAGVFALSAMYIILTVLLFPCSLLTILAGLLFGLPIAIPTVVLAATAGSSLAFVLGRYLMQDFVQKMAAKYRVMGAVHKVMSRNGFKVSFLLRLSPIIPFNALNYALSLTEISLLHYVVSTFLGIIPGTVLFCFIGSTAQSISEATSGDLSLDEDEGGGVAAGVLFFVGLAITILVQPPPTKRMAAKKAPKKAPSKACGSAPRAAR